MGPLADYGAYLSGAGSQLNWGFILPGALSGEPVPAFVVVALAPPAFRRTQPPGREYMASGTKRKTTMAKLNRERAVRERRLRKQAKKDARKQAAAASPSDEVPSDDDR